jgi:hypothetical protein
VHLEEDQNPQAFLVFGLLHGPVTR